MMWRMLACLPALLTLFACGGSEAHIAQAVDEEQETPMSVTHNVSMLISDNGMVRYKVTAAERKLYEAHPGVEGHWDFEQGFTMQRFGEDWAEVFSIRSDTAYLRGEKLWELRGNVVVRDTIGRLFETEELFWDMARHEFYSTVYVHFVDSTQELDGYDFRSSEDMKRYTISNSTGRLPANTMQ